MSDVAIQVDAMGKRYRISTAQVRYETLRDRLADAVTAPWRKLRDALNGGAERGGGTTQTFWALKDLSFEVTRGEVIGIIGRNGAGKTTLLKLLSRITEPTEGRAEIHGRVGSLLEVGTGFHPELTGRENVYLNGAILGMKKVDIDRQFDEIVAFAEVEKFVDTPLKRYSTGMQVRLSFAVAAHLEPEILLVDEVLAVGDAAFQTRCLRKMDHVAGTGRTVVFVSHQMNQIRRLCGRCVWIDQGRLRRIGASAEVVAAYEVSETGTGFGSRESTDARWAGRTDAQFLSWAIVSPDCDSPNVLTSAGECSIAFVVRANRPIVSGHHGVALFDGEQRLVWATSVDRLRLRQGLHRITYTLAGLPIRPGTYRWLVSLYDDGELLDQWSCLPELVVATDPLTHPLDNWQGILNVPWKLEVATSAS